MSVVPEKYYQVPFDAYEKLHPNVTIKLEAISFETSVSGIKNRVKNNDDTFDIFLADQSWTTDFASDGTLLDLTDTPYAKLAKEKMPPSVIAYSSYQGRLVAAPFWGSFNVLLYNKTLLEKAGIPFPSSDPATSMTYEDLFDQAKKAQAAGAKWGLYWDQPDFYYERQSMIESAGGGSGLTGSDLLTPDVNNAGWRKALTYYSKVFSEGLAPRGGEIEQTDPLFNNGELAFYVTEAPVAGLKESGVSYGIAAMPRFEGGEGYTPTGSHGWGVNPHTPHLDAALDFITWYSLTLEGTMAGSEVSGTPTLPEGLAARLGVSIEKDPQLTGLDTLVHYLWENHPVVRPPSSKYTTFESVVNPAILDIRNGLDVSKTLGDAQEKLTQLLSR